MCKALQLQRSTYYYEAKERVKKDDITSEVIEIFKASRQNYGTRKSKVVLKKRGHMYPDEDMLIDEALEMFEIQRSLSMNGCQYDDTVVEATFKCIKTVGGSG